MAKHFDPTPPSYFAIQPKLKKKTHTHTPIKIKAFREYFTAHFSSSHPGVAAEVDWEGWFLKEGMPPVEPVYDLSLLKPVKELAADFAEVGI